MLVFKQTTIAIWFSFIVAGCVFDPSGIFPLVILCTLQLGPFAICWIYRRVDYLSLILGAQFIGYSAANVARVVWHPLSQPLSPQAITGVRVLLLCTALMVGGFYGVRYFWREGGAGETGFRPIRIASRELLGLGIAILVCFAFIGHKFDDANGLILTCQFVLCVFAFTLEVPEHPWFRRGLQGLVVGGVVYSYLLDTSLGFAVNLLVIWVMQAILNRNARSLVHVLALLLLMLPLQWVKGDYRYVVGQHPTYGVWRRGVALVELLEEKVAARPRTALTLPAPERTLANLEPERVLSSSEAAHEAYLASQALKSAIDRVRDDTLDRVLIWTPANVGFWDGFTYRNFFHLILPEVVFGYSNDWNIWNRFGKAYGIISPADNITEVVFSSFVEAYINFGYLWLFVFAGLLGIGIAFLQGIAVKVGRDDQISSFAFICFLMPFLSYQQDFGSSVAKLIFTSLVIFPLAWAFRQRGRRGAPRAS